MACVCVYVSTCLGFVGMRGQECSQMDAHFQADEVIDKSDSMCRNKRMHGW